MRIGVLADTHIPDKLNALPARVLELFSTVEIVLHAGDISSLELLQELQEKVSLTFPVYGENDPPEVRRLLQDSQVLEFGGRRIGLIHGHSQKRRGWRELINAKAFERRVQEFVLSQFKDVDAIVYGYTHRAFAKTINGIFLFNPGSPIPNAPGGPSVGLLEITGRGISGKIMKL